MDINSHIFVTGGTGFVGAYVLKRLEEKGYRNIRALKRRTSRMDLVNQLTSSVEWVEGDLFDYHILLDEMHKADIVIHSAAMISFVKRDFREMLRVNVEGTAHMVNTALEGGVEKFLQVSSVAALGQRSSSKSIISEETPFAPSPLNTGYGQSKHLAEREIWRGVSEGLNATIINPVMILGAGYWDTGSCRLFRTIDNGLPFYPTGENGIVDVRDVAQMSIEMLEKDVMQQNMICSAKNLPLRTLLDQIASAINRPKPRFALNRFIRGLTWRGAQLAGMLTGRKPLITRETMRTSTSSYHFDNAKSKSVLGYNYIDAEQTISQTSEAYLASKKSSKSFGVLT